MMDSLDEATKQVARSPQYTGSLLLADADGRGHWMTWHADWTDDVSLWATRLHVTLTGLMRWHADWTGDVADDWTDDVAI